MKIKYLMIGFAFLVSESAYAVSTVFFPTNQNVNFVATVNGGSTGLELGMFDDANTGFTGTNFLQIALGNDTATFAPTIGQNVDYTITNSSDIGSPTNNSATLLGSDLFILGMRDTTISASWMDPDAIVCNSQNGTCSVSWSGLSTELIVDIQPVPVPAALWLFGSGLLGLVGIARRKAA